MFYVNESINHQDAGNFQSHGKKINVVPIFKSKDPFSMNNYRPISLLSCVAKVFERRIFKYIFNNFEDNSLINITC